MTEETKTLNLDSQTGIKTDFTYRESSSGRESDDEIIISTSQDVSAIIKANERSRNAVDRHHPHGEWSKVASIPLSIYYDLKQRGIVDDPKAMRRWLNDPDNRYFRTREAKI